MLPREVPVYWMEAIEAGPLSVVGSAKLSMGSDGIHAEFKLPTGFIKEEDDLDCRLAIVSNRWPYAGGSPIHYCATAIEVRRHHA